MKTVDLSHLQRERGGGGEDKNSFLLILFSFLNIKKRNNAEEHCFIPLTQTLSPLGARA